MKIMDTICNTRKKAFTKKRGNADIKMGEVTKVEKYAQKPVSRATSASNAGILYYKCLSDAMEKKINELQKGIEKAESTMKIQKQNISDMINRKNKTLCEFHENFRKYTRKTEYENKIEDEIEQLVKFLDELMLLHNEICYVKTSENDIRNHAITNLQTVCSDLQSVKNVYEKNIEQMQLKLKDLKEWKTQWETHDKLNLEINRAIHLHQEKLKQLRWNIKNEIADGEILKSDGERIQVQTEAEILKTQQTLKNDAIKIQQAFYCLKNQFSELKSFQNSFVEVEQKLKNYNERLMNQALKLNQIETNIMGKKLKYEELEKKVKINFISLHAVEDEKKIQVEKQRELEDVLRKFGEKISGEEVLLKDLVEEERSIEEKQNQLKEQIKILKGKIASFDTQKTYSNEVALNETLGKEIDDLNQKNTIAKKRLLELSTEAEAKKKKINELKNSLLSKNILIYENLSDQNFLHSFLTIENEQNVASDLIDTELDTLFDKICEQRPHIHNLENRFEELSIDGRILEEEVTRKEKQLQETIASAKMYDANILVLKQNVYQKKSVTVAELSRQAATLSNHVEIERNAVEKLKQEIADLGKRRLLYTPEKKRSVASGRTIRSRKKVEDVKVINEKNNSSGGDVYSFK